MDKEKIIRAAFEAGYELGYADSSEGVHIKLEKVIEHFMKSDRFLILHTDEEPAAFTETEPETNISITDTVH